MLTFGEAIEAVKQGKRIARNGWNGKGMFVFMRPEDTVTVEMALKFKSLPDCVKSWLDNNFEDKQSEIKLTAYLCMKAADNSIVNGWLASQTDMLSNDWVILDD